MRVHPEESMLPNVGNFFRRKSTPYAAFGFWFSLSIVVAIGAAENEHCMKDCQPPQETSVQYFFFKTLGLSFFAWLKQQSGKTR